MNLIPKSERNNFKLIFDECGNVDYLIQDYFSMNIDENILLFSSYIYNEESYKKFGDELREVEITKCKNGIKELNKNLFVEN